MFEAKFDQASFFKKIIDSLKGLVDDCAFMCDESGMKLRAIDVSHVSLIDINLPASFISEYRFNNEQPLKLAFNTDVISKVLKSASSDDILMMRVENEGSDIEIQIVSQSESKQAVFRMRPTDAESDSVEIPEDKQSAAILEISSAQLNQLVRSLSEVSDSVTVRCENDQIKFSVQDQSLEATTIFTNGINESNAAEDVNVTINNPVKVSYALRYLKTFAAASALSSRVKLEFSQNFPLLIEYSLEEDGAYVRFYLAPKVEEDESDEDI